MGITKIQPGNRYHRLTVIRDSGLRAGRTQRVHLILCRCDCGIEKLFRAGSLLQGTTKSCGCFKREFASAMGAKTRTHGCSRTGSLTYQSWTAMRDRCLTKTHHQYPEYGGRGIRIDPRWNDFSVFLADMGERPSQQHTLDRYPDQNGNYEPTNTRWATKKQQSRNTRFNVNIEYKGRIASIAEWAEELGLNHSTLCERLRQGWSVEKAIETPKRKYVRVREAPAREDD
jgi:hypothetical protein